MNKEHNAKHLKLAKKIWKETYSELDFELFYKLSQSPCHYCGKSGTSDLDGFKYNIVDCVDDAKGCVQSNVVPACRICDHMKGSESYNDFLDWVKRVVELAKARKCVKK